MLAIEGICLHRSERAIDAVQGGARPPRTRIEETVLDLTQTAKTLWEACGTAAEVARVLRLHGWDGQPRPCSPGCSVRPE